MNKGSILIIDDEEIVRTSCQRILEPEGYSVKTADQGSNGLAVLESHPIDLVLTDLMMPDIDGIEVLRSIKEKWPETEVIIMTGYGTVKTAVRAMKIGVFDYLEKPFTPADLLSLTEKALCRNKLAPAAADMKEVVPSHYELGNIVGISPPMQKVFHLIARVANTGSTVLVTGESGTGKELVAKAIHFNSSRKDQPFIVVDCTTIPEPLIESELFGHAKGAFTGAHEKKKGLLELANGGTIFFDEIGNLTVATQAKLLRVLQEREFRPLGEKKSVHIDVRFISATNRDLKKMTREGTFREDFFYRLNIFPIHLPPLRERKEDIPALVRHFVERKSRELKLAAPPPLARGVIDQLLAYSWPGNVRELENVVERALILSKGEPLTFDDLLGGKFGDRPPIAVEPQSQTLKLDGIISSHIRRVLEMTKGKVHGKGGAAELLGINPSTLRNRMNQLEIPYGRRAARL